MASADLLAADDARVDALRRSSIEDLLPALDDEFLYIHSSGRTENHASYVQSIRSGRVVYVSVDVGQRSTWVEGRFGIIQGQNVMSVMIDGAPKQLDVTYLSVWRQVGRRWVMRYWCSAPNVTPQGPKTASALGSEIQRRLSLVATPTIINVLYRHGYRNVMVAGARPLRRDQPRLVGPAYTLRFIPAREDLDSMAQYAQSSNPHRRAIEECPPGAVLVIDANGSTAVSSMGDLMARRLRVRGAAGVVTDGGFRDSRGIIESGLPCFQRASAAPPTPIALHPLDLNVPIGCGGVAVYPGDVIVGDSEGVVVIPRHLVEVVADEAEAATDYELFAELEIENGQSILDVLPATPESSRRYEQWVANGRPERSR